MISFKDIKLTEQKNTIYIPQHLKWTLENFLKRDFPDMETMDYHVMADERRFGGSTGKR